MENKNRGLILEPLAPEDFVFGGKTKLKGQVINPSGDWTPYAPEYEHQAPHFETSGCVSFGTLNCLEMLLRFHFKETLNLSDRFVVKGSGTDPHSGNQPKTVAQFIRDKWSVFEPEYPMTETVEEYFSEIPKSLFELAKSRKIGKDFGYEYVQPTIENLRNALTQGTVGMSVALLKDEDGKYYRPNGWRDSHWVSLLRINKNNECVILDQYEPFIKTIRADFVSEYAVRYGLNEREYSLVTQLLKALRNYLASFQRTSKEIVDGEASPLNPANPPAAPLPPKENLLNAFCLAIQKHEGWILPGKPGYPNGSRSFRNNNPGNLKYVGQANATAKDDKGFAIFTTYEHGFSALKAMVRNAATGKSAVYHPHDTFYAFFRKYAPAFDNNNPLAYAEAVAKAVGVPPETTISSLV